MLSQLHSLLKSPLNRWHRPITIGRQMLTKGRVADRVCHYNGSPVPFDRTLVSSVIPRHVWDVFVVPLHRPRNPTLLRGLGEGSPNLGTDAPALAGRARERAEGDLLFPRRVEQ